MMIKHRLAALSASVAGALGFTKSDLRQDRQAGPRTLGSQLNYNAVQTLDPTVLAAAFAQADQGYVMEQAALFELVEERDPHIYSEMAKRKRAITSLGWQLHPPKDASQSEIDRTTELDELLRGNPHFEDAQYDLADAVGKGFAALEIEWRTGSTWEPKCYNWVPQRRLQIDRETGAYQFLNNGIPEPLRAGCWVIHEHKAKSGYIEQAALFRVLAWTYAYKAYNTLDMQRFLEVYGMPLRLGKYPPGLGEKERNELLRAVKRIGSDGAGVVPSNMSIEFIQAQAKGNVDDFLSAIQYWERKQSMAILGGTLTSQADGKSSTNALGQVHDKVRREIMLHDVRQLSPTIQDQIVRRIALINGMFAPDRLPTFAYQTEETVDQAKMADVLTKVVGLGLEVDLDWAHAAIQIPRAGKDAVLLGKKPTAQIQLTRLAALRAAAAATAAPVDITTELSMQLAQQTARHEQTLVQQIAAVVAESGDFDTALSNLEALVAQGRTSQTITPWAHDIAKGTSAAILAGRADVHDEAAKE